MINEQNCLGSPRCHDLFYTRGGHRRLVGAILWQKPFCAEKGLIDKERFCDFVRLRPRKRESDRIVFATNSNNGVVPLTELQTGQSRVRQDGEPSSLDGDEFRQRQVGGSTINEDGLTVSN